MGVVVIVIAVKLFSLLTMQVGCLIVFFYVVVGDAGGLLQSGLTWMDSCQPPPFCRQPPPSHLTSL